MTQQINKKEAFSRRVVFLLVLLVISVIQVAACPKDKTGRHISRPEKIWSAFHPVKAKKVLSCARLSIWVTDSLEKAGVLTDKNGGQLDAFRHAYWMALLITRDMKEEVVRKVGQRHEKGNYIDFRKGKLEESVRADSMMSVMDLRNNEKGIEIGHSYLNGDKKLSLIEYVLKEVWNGTLSIMRKNAQGDYLDERGNVIDLTLYAGKWYIPKCIVKSDMIAVEH